MMKKCDFLWIGKEYASNNKQETDSSLYFNLSILLSKPNRGFNAEHTRHPDTKVDQGGFNYLISWLGFTANTSFYIRISVFANYFPTLVINLKSNISYTSMKYRETQTFRSTDICERRLENFLVLKINADLQGCTVFASQAKSCKCKCCTDWQLWANPALVSADSDWLLTYSSLTN